MEPRSPALQADSLLTEPPGKPRSGKPIRSPGDLPDPGIKPGSPALQVDSLAAELSERPRTGPQLTQLEELAGRGERTLQVVSSETQRTDSMLNFLLQLWPFLVGWWKQL